MEQKVENLEKAVEKTIKRPLTDREAAELRRLFAAAIQGGSFEELGDEVEKIVEDASFPLDKGGEIY